jgi:alkylation response protein AidB-like acyl-CoA dehydrogenase
MLFADSETQRLLRDTARSFLAGRYPWERLYEMEAKKAGLTRADLRELAGLGWLALLTPGAGTTLLDAAVVVEELGYAAVPAPVAVSNVAAYVIASGDAADGAREHLAALASADRLYTIAEASRRRGRPSPRALDASGGALRGTLPLVPFAGEADFVLAPLTLDGEPAFAALPLGGATREATELLDRASYANLVFDSPSLDGALILARGARAEELHERCDALSTAFSLIELAGMMQRVLEMTVQYITQRVQFGRPIGTFQAARHRAAELLLQTETTRWAAYHALARFQDDASDTEEIWLAKHWAIRAAERVYQNAHILHGGVGVGLEYPLHLFTQQIAGFAARAGTMNEMVARTLDALGVSPKAAAAR